VTRGVPRHWVTGLLLIALAVLVSACATRDPWQDARIESEVKARLVAERSANLTRLGVVSRKAVVHLSGTVASADEKALAEQVAKRVSGVRRVVNTVDVQPSAVSPAGKSS
jgi:BON domain